MRNYQFQTHKRALDKVKPTLKIEDSRLEKMNLDFKTRAQKAMRLRQLFDFKRNYREHERLVDRFRMIAEGQRLSVESNESCNDQYVKRKNLHRSLNITQRKKEMKDIDDKNQLLLNRIMNSSISSQISYDEQKKFYKHQRQLGKFFSNTSKMNVA